MNRLLLFLIVVFFASFIAFMTLFNDFLGLPERLAGVLAFCLAGLVFYFSGVFYEKAIKYKSMGIPLNDLVFHKDNIHELNFKAQFANFREQYLTEKNLLNWGLGGVPFDEIVDTVEKRVLLLAKKPQSFNDTNYEDAVFAEILQELSKRITYGTFAFGQPTTSTSTLVSIYCYFVKTAWSKGFITSEVRDEMIFEINDIVKNHG